MSGQSHCQNEKLFPDLSGVEMVRRSPCEALAGIVTELTGYREFAASPSRQVENASLTVPFIISFGEPFAIGLSRTPGHDDRFGSFTSGLHAGPVVIDSFGKACCIQLNFTPLGARRFFGIPMNELTSRLVLLDDVLGPEAKTLRERLLNASGWSQRFDIAERFVMTRIAAAPKSSDEVRWAFECILTSGGRARVSSIAENIGWSKKHLASRFHLEVGIGPKTLSRIVRFNSALKFAQQGREGSWAQIAAECGYADQAHLAREFRDYSGRSPVELVTLAG